MKEHVVLGEIMFTVNLCAVFQELSVVYLACVFHRGFCVWFTCWWLFCWEHAWLWWDCMGACFPALWFSCGWCPPCQPSSLLPCCWNHLQSAINLFFADCSLDKRWNMCIFINQNIPFFQSKHPYFTHDIRCSHFSVDMYSGFISGCCGETSRPRGGGPFSSGDRSQKDRRASGG